MNILLDVYLDRNIGDDMMIRTAAEKLSGHNFFVSAADKTNLLAFADIENIKEYNGEEIQAVVTLGGSMFELGSTKTILNRLKTTVKALRNHKRSGKKIATIGCNLGYVNRKLAVFAVKEQLKQSGLVTLRDKRSMKRLENIGINSEYYPDILFTTEITKPETRSGLAISVYRNHSRVEDNLACYKKYAQIADEYIERTGEDVKLLVFDSGVEGDLIAGFTVRQLMKHPHKTKTVVYIDDPEPILSAVASSACVLGTRFHSIVFALVAQVPVLPVSYSDKTRGLLEDLGYAGITLEHRLLSDVDAKEIVGKLVAKDELLKLSDEKIDELKNKANGHITALAKYLGG